MPSSSGVQAVVGRQPVGLSFQTPPSFRANVPLISPLSYEAIGDELVCDGSTFANVAYPAASRVLAYPFVLAEPFLVKKVFAYTATTGGTDSMDIGVYTEDGATLLVHGGSTLKGGANNIQEIDCTDTLLPRGRFWCAYVQSGTTATNYATAPGAAILRAVGCAQMAGSGSTLGSTFTPAAVAGTNLPFFGIANRTLVG